MGNLNTKENIKKFTPHILLYAYEAFRIRQRNSKYRQEKIYHKWVSQNKPKPVPHIVKQKAVEEYQLKYKLKTLIETGTFLGDMVYSQKDNFNNLISIELDYQLFKDVKKKLRLIKNIEIIHGDSGIALKEIVPKINNQCLFWLDGHYSAGFTAKGNIETPIISELDTILSNKMDHVILIDDARCFTGVNDYPTLKFVEEFSLNKKNNYLMQVEDDIIRLLPKYQS